MESKEVNTVSRTFLIAVVLFAWLTGFAKGHAEDAAALPVLLQGFPEKIYEILGPVDADAKELPEARKNLQKQAAKMESDAVILVRCEEGGIRRQGMTWYHVKAHCRGVAVRYKEGA